MQALRDEAAAEEEHPCQPPMTRRCFCCHRARRRTRRSSWRRGCRAPSSAPRHLKWDVAVDEDGVDDDVEGHESDESRGVYDEQGRRLCNTLGARSSTTTTAFTSYPRRMMWAGAAPCKQAINSSPASSGHTNRKEIGDGPQLAGRKRPRSLVPIWG